jgi:hypothetical protein
VNPKVAYSGSLERYNPPLHTYKISRTPQSICSCSSLPKSAKSHFGCLGCLGVKNSTAEEHGFQDAIGMIDGMHMILACRPNQQGEGYFNRKSRYSIQCMIINDNNCCILHILACFTRASHDT